MSESKHTPHALLKYALNANGPVNGETRRLSESERWAFVEAAAGDPIIAAAPEMYEALRGLLACHTTSEVSGVATSIWDKAKKDADTALAKAAGEVSS